MAGPYDAFISYSHSLDGRLAPAVQRCLHQLGRPWNKPRALRVFRDETNLSASPDLWTSIESALLASRYFVLLASPEASASPWIRKEVETWRRERDPADLLIALTGGELHWDAARGDIDWARTTALPDALRGWLPAEPLWVDLRWARAETDLSLRHSRFRQAVATLAAPIHGVERDALESEDVRQHRRRLRLVRAGVSALAVLLVIAVGLGLATYRQTGVARQQRDEAQRQGRIALSRALAAEAVTRLDTDAPLATRLALAAYGAAPTAEARGGLMRALDTGRHVTAYVRGGIDQVSTRRAASAASRGSVALTPDGGLLAYVSDQDDAITLYDTGRRVVVGTLRDRDRPYFQDLAIDPTGRLLAAYADGRLDLFDLRTRALRWTAEQPSLGSDLAFSPDSRLLVGWDGESEEAPRLRVRDVSDGRSRSAPALTGEPAGPIAFGPDGQLLTSMLDRGLPAGPTGIPQARIHQVDLSTGAGSVLPVVTDRFKGMAVAADGTLAVVHAGNLEVWAPGGRRRTAARTVTPLVAVAVAADGRTVVAADDAGGVTSWDAGLTRPVAVTRHPSEVLDLAVGGGQVASTEENLAVTLSTPATDHRLRTLGARTDRVGRAVAVAVSPDGGTAAVSVGANIQLWPLGPGGAPRVLAAPATVTGLAYAPDGRSLAVRTGTELVVIDPASGRATLRLGLDSSDSLEGSDSVAFAPDGKLVVTDGPDGEYVADLRSGTWATTLPAERAGLAGSADRSVLAVPTQLYTPVAGGSQVSLLRWPGPTPYRTVTENALLRELALSPTGDRMAAADLDERVITWTTTDGRRTVLPSVGSTGQLAFAAGGTLLFGWTDLSGVLSVWDPVNSAAIGAWTVDTPSFAPSSVPVSSTAIAATPAGLLTGHWDGHLTLWNTRVEYWAATLCTLAGGDLTPAERTTYLADTPVPPACP